MVFNKINFLSVNLGDDHYIINYVTQNFAFTYPLHPMSQNAHFAHNLFENCIACHTFPNTNLLPPPRLYARYVINEQTLNRHPTVNDY